MTSHHDDKVLDLTRQQLSALFDGELAADEGRFLQRRLRHDRDLAACWSRWQLAGDVLRGQAVAAAPAGFAEGVAAAVTAEFATATVAAPAARPTRRRGMLLPGAALAASVAALAMFMTRQAPDIAAPTAPAMEFANAADTVPAQPRPPLPASPAPATPAAPDAFAAAGTAIAVAEVPRRAAERRSRSQQQRAAATRLRRDAPEPRLVAAAAPSTTPGLPAEPAASPFVPEAAAEVLTSRPWPRALLPGNGGAFAVGYGRLQSGDPVAQPQSHPFQPRPVALPRPAADSTLPEDTD